MKHIHITQISCLYCINYYIKAVSLGLAVPACSFSKFYRYEFFLYVELSFSILIANDKKVMLPKEQESPVWSVYISNPLGEFSGNCYSHSVLSCLGDVTAHGRVQEGLSRDA